MSIEIIFLIVCDAYEHICHCFQHCLLHMADADADPRSLLHVCYSSANFEHQHAKGHASLKQTNANLDVLLTK